MTDLSSCADIVENNVENNDDFNLKKEYCKYILEHLTPSVPYTTLTYFQHGQHITYHFYPCPDCSRINIIVTTTDK
jgi:hypothetical protein